MFLGGVNMEEEQQHPEDVDDVEDDGVVLLSMATAGKIVVSILN